LRYELVPFNPNVTHSWLSRLFMTVFWSLFGFILFSSLLSCWRTSFTNNSNQTFGYGSFPGASGPPPPYNKGGQAEEARWRPGFYTGMGLGALASRLFTTRRSATRPFLDEYDPFTGYGTIPYHGVYYEDGNLLHDDRTNMASTSGTHHSTGFGGTENR